MSFPPAERLPRVVLDSNVWIDILVFDDPATRPIAAALENARIDVVIDHRCRAELSRVLDYPQFARFAIDKDTALARVDGWTTPIPLPAEPATQSVSASGTDADATTTGTTTAAGLELHAASGARIASGSVSSADALRLPQCRDRDDQKFLELAHRARADWLVSKDRELLRMAKRIARDFGFAIGLPAAFVESRREV